MWAACALDGFNIAAGSGGSSAFISGPITTANSNDVIVIVESNILTTNSGFGGVTGITGGGLTWVQRGSSVTAALTGCDGVGCALEVSEWWAVAASPLTAQTFTLAMNATWQSNSGFTHVHVFGFSGLSNPSSPWDSNGSLPAHAVNTSTSGTPMTVLGVSTSNANDVLITACATNDPTGPHENCSDPPPPPLVAINTFRNVDAFLGILYNSLALYQPLSGVLSNAPVNLNNGTLSTTEWWAAFADALACTAVSPTPSHSTNRFLHGWPW